MKDDQLMLIFELPDSFPTAVGTATQQFHVQEDSCLPLEQQAFHEDRIRQTLLPTLKRKALCWFFSASRYPQFHASVVHLFLVFLFQAWISVRKPENSTRVVTSLKSLANSERVRPVDGCFVLLSGDLSPPQAFGESLTVQPQPSSLLPKLNDKKIISLEWK